MMRCGEDRKRNMSLWNLLAVSYDDVLRVALALAVLAAASFWAAALAPRRAG